MTSPASRSVTISNRAGLHARPCHAVVTTAMNFKAKFRVRYSGREVNGKSILELMTLGAALGAQLELFAEGSDAQALIDRVGELIEGGFGEIEV